MLNKLALVFYYVFVSHLPNTKYTSLFNKFRVFYVSKVLQVMVYHQKTIFENSVYISDCKNLTIGEYCHINERVFIQGATIGSNVMIAPDVSILSNSHAYDRLDIPMIEQEMIVNSCPVIESDVWIGRNVVILHGVRIGKGSIVGAGSVVTKDIEPYSIVGGVPAKLIKSRIEKAVDEIK